MTKFYLILVVTFFLSCNLTADENNVEAIDLMYTETKQIFDFVVQRDKKKETPATRGIAEIFHASVYSSLEQAYMGKKMAALKSINKDIREMASNLNDSELEQLNQLIMDIGGKTIKQSPH